MKKQVKGFIDRFWHVLQKAASRLQHNNPLHLAGATAFFATFSLAPIFFMIVQLLGQLIGKKEVQETIIKRFAQSAPDESADQFRRLLNGLQSLSGNWLTNAGLFLFLIFSASTLFTIIRSSLHRLWRLKQVKKQNVGFAIRQRLLSVLLVIAAGVLLLAGLVGQGLQGLLGEAVADVLPSAFGYFQSLYKHVISVLVAWGWFAVVFRYITDARPQWKTVLVGALFTSFLFNIGKAILQVALSGGSLPTVFGASTSLVLMQLFVFYSSLLIYYGASFTMEWARHHQQKIKLPAYLHYYTIEEKHTAGDG